MEVSPRGRRLLVFALKLAVFVAVLWGVWRTVYRGWNELSAGQWQVSWPWLVVAGAIYAVGLLPSAWFWRRILIALGDRPPWSDVLKAYYIGHLGKYVPGKGLVVFLRVALLPRQSVALRTAVVSVFLETLTMMAVGALLAAALSLWLLDGHAWAVALMLLVVLLAGLPTLPPVARFILRLIDSRLGSMAGLRAAFGNHAKRDCIAGQLHGITWRLMAGGWIASIVGWCLFSMSLWAILRSVGVDQVHPIAQGPVLLAAVATAIVAGFASMLPGGLGVRDAMLVALLAGRYGDATALVAAVLMRLVWIFTELAVCGIVRVASASRK